MPDRIVQGLLILAIAGAAVAVLFYGMQRGSDAQLAVSPPRPAPSTGGTRRLPPSVLDDACRAEYAPRFEATAYREAAPHTTSTGVRILTPPVPMTKGFRLQTRRTNPSLCGSYLAQPQR